MLQPSLAILRKDISLGSGRLARGARLAIRFQNGRRPFARSGQNPSRLDLLVSLSLLYDQSVPDDKARVGLLRGF